jgi:Tfp pilus assembly protein PilW
MIQRPASQRGWTLTSLMVGLLVSMLVIIAMLSLYRIVVRMTFDPTYGMQPTAAQDRQATTGFLAAQNQLQSAGFGVASAARNTDIVLVSGSTVVTIPNTGATVSGTAIYWDSNLNPTGTANWVCKGLASQSSGTPTTWTLSLVQASGTCNPVSSTWNSASLWTTTTVLASGLPSAITFSASASTGACWPFGAEAGSSMLALGSMSTLASSQSAVAGVQVTMGWSTSTGTNSWSTCLPNFTT